MKEKDIRIDERKKVIEEVWEMLRDFRKYDPHNILMDADIAKGRLKDIGGEGCNLEMR